MRDSGFRNTTIRDSGFKNTAMRDSGFVVASCSPVDSDFRTTTSQEREAVPRKTRIQGSLTFVSLHSRLESDRIEEKILKYYD